MEELLTPFALFFLFGGGALVVAFVIIRSFFKRDRSEKPYKQWITVVILSIGQVGCWKMMDKFDSAFGAGGKFDLIVFIFILITSMWLIYQIATYMIQKRKMPERQEGLDKKT